MTPSTAAIRQAVRTAIAAHNEARTAAGEAAAAREKADRLAQVAKDAAHALRATLPPHGRVVYNGSMIEVDRGLPMPGQIGYLLLTPIVGVEDVSEGSVCDCKGEFRVDFTPRDFVPKTVERELGLTVAPESPKLPSKAPAATSKRAIKADSVPGIDLKDAPLG